MGKYIFILIGVLLPLVSLAKETDPPRSIESILESVSDNSMEKLLTVEDPNRCYRLFYNAAKIIPRLYREHKRDSIDLIIEYIDEDCGIQSFSNLRMLLAIEDGDSFAEFCDKKFLDQLIGNPYTAGFVCWPEPYLAMGRFGWYATEEYETFIQNLADELSTLNDSNTVAHLICRYFAGGDYDYAIERLSSGEVEESCLKRMYDDKVAQVRHDLIRNPRLNWSLNTGMWSPLDKASALGNHLELGGAAGVRFNRIGVDLRLALRTLDAKQEYEVGFGDRTAKTDFFLGGYVGIEGAYEFLRFSSFSSEVLFGIGWDGFSAFPEDHEDDKSINSLNLSVGWTGRLYTTATKSYHLGLQVRYNFVKYGTNGGTDLSGNAVSVNLLFGFLGNEEAIDRAKYLGLFKPDW